MRLRITNLLLLSMLFGFCNQAHPMSHIYEYANRLRNAASSAISYFNPHDQQNQQSQPQEPNPQTTPAPQPSGSNTTTAQQASSTTNSQLTQSATQAQPHGHHVQQQPEHIQQFNEYDNDRIFCSLCQSELSLQEPFYFLTENSCACGQIKLYHPTCFHELDNQCPTCESSINEEPTILNEDVLLAFINAAAPQSSSAVTAPAPIPHDESYLCLICRDNPSPDTQGRVTRAQQDCNCTQDRFYHTECFDGLMSSDRRCPVCRETIQGSVRKTFQQFQQSPNAPRPETPPTIITTPTPTTPATSTTSASRPTMTPSPTPVPQQTTTSSTSTTRSSFAPTASSITIVPFNPADNQPAVSTTLVPASATALSETQQQTSVQSPSINSDLQQFLAHNHFIYQQLQEIDVKIQMRSLNPIDIESSIRQAEQQFLQNGAEGRRIIQQNNYSPETQFIIESMIKRLEDRGTLVLRNYENVKREREYEQLRLSEQLRQAFFQGQQEILNSIPARICSICGENCPLNESCTVITSKDCPSMQPYTQRYFHQSCITAYKKIAPDGCPVCRKSHQQDFAG